MKRLLSILLSLVMLVALFPAFGALADDTVMTATTSDGRSIMVATDKTDLSTPVAAGCVSMLLMIAPLNLHTQKILTRKS